MSTGSPSPHKTALEFKSTSLNVPSLILISDQINQFEHHLKEKIAQAPEFFKHSPVLIDLQDINKKGLEINLAEFVDVLKIHHFLPIGVRGGTKEQNSIAIALHLPVHSAHSTMPPAQQKNQPKTIKPENQAEQSAQTPVQSNGIENKLVTQPIRSGQRVYAKGDLIITAPVSAGAEVVAEGNIHIYGALRGRALAGAQGAEDSLIFCSDLHAELVAIAGNYKVSDDIEDAVKNKPVQISLDDQALIIQPI